MKKGIVIIATSTKDGQTKKTTVTQDAAVRTRSQGNTGCNSCG